jgi:serine/threonine protein kinase
MLKMFSDDAHPHLISLMATYEQFRIYFLVFPWADSDLEAFWRTEKPTPKFDIDTVKWVAKQCEGIADGLVKIHQYRTSNAELNQDSNLLQVNPDQTKYGRHGDLKPENILWFNNRDGGILKISDFGLSEFSTKHSKSGKPRSGIATSPSYRPPECDIPGATVGPSYDIWTLGCLYLEFITWLLGGWELISRFQHMRMSIDHMWYDMVTDTFFEVEVKDVPDNKEKKTVGARLKPAVKRV